MGKLFWIAAAIFIIGNSFFGSCRQNDIIPPESQSQYIIYHLNNGVVLKFLLPFDTLGAKRIGAATKIRASILAAYDPKWTRIDFSGPAAPGDYALDSQMLATTSYDFYQLSGPLTVHIFEYDSVGGFITGNFNGDVQWFGPFSASGIVPMSCQFRVKRWK